jgi:hypothetical protein
MYGILDAPEFGVEGDVAGLEQQLLERRLSARQSKIGHSLYAVRSVSPRLETAESED